MKKKTSKRKSKIVFAILLLTIVLPNVFLVIRNIRFVYYPWIDDEAFERLRWVGDNLCNSTKPIVFVVSGNEERLSGDVDYWRTVISAYVPDNLVYVGKLDYLLLFREPRFENTKLQAYAESYWNQLKTLVGSPQNLTTFTVVIIDNFYQPTTMLELATRVAQVHDGVYVVKNYTAVNRLILFGALNYYYFEGPWYGMERNWSSYGTVLEINDNISTDFFVAYAFHLYENGNYTISMSIFDASPTYVPVTVMMDNEQIMLIDYSGTESPRTYNSTIIFLAEGNHTIRVSPALNGWLFFDLDYIEIDKIGS